MFDIDSSSTCRTLKKLEFELRQAVESDVAAISDLIAASVRGLAKGIYNDKQIDLSIRSVFGVDHQLIADRTYFVVDRPITAS